MTRIHLVRAIIGDTVEVKWLDKDGNAFVVTYTAPPKATREAVQLREQEQRQ